MQRTHPTTLSIDRQTDGAWAGRYADAAGTVELVAGCASPEVVEATVLRDLGVRPARIELEPLSLIAERRALNQAHRDIAAVMSRIRAQEGLLATLEQDGHDTAPGHWLLGVFRETLRTMVEHRASSSSNTLRAFYPSGQSSGGRCITDESTRVSSPVAANPSLGKSRLYSLSRLG